MNCPRCRAGNPPGHKFCSQCAAPLPEVCGACGFLADTTARFCGGCGISVDASGRFPRPAGSSAGRRHLTVMFCDLVGSTDMSVRIDPEDLSDILRQYQVTCEGVIAHYGGYVARYTGDGLLVYFGYPEATEHDAERAVRSGLGIIEAVQALRPRRDLTLHSRVGIASGPVVVGEVVGGGAAREETVVGETPNLASRLQSIALPDTVVISGRTRKLLSGLFEYSDLGYPPLKGFDQPIHAYVVCGESILESRFEATHSGLLGALHGREREQRALQDSWARARSGIRQLVVICGEPGIGKSHLLENFRASLAREPAEIIRMYGSPHATGSVLQPVIRACKRLAGFQADDPVEVQLDKLEHRFSQFGPIEPAALALLGALLGIPEDSRFTTPQLSPPELKSRILNLLVSQLANQCRVSPVVLVVEDLQLLDASSIEFLDLLIHTVKRLPLLIVVTCRTGFRERWLEVGETARIVLGRLAAESAQAIVNQVAGGKALPGKIVADILDKTEGVPLFIEELTKTIVESPLLIEKADCYVVTDNRSLLTIPGTLQASLMARIDRLVHARDIAQVGAAVGREFRPELLRAVLGWPMHSVLAGLDELLAAHLVIKRGDDPNQSYFFKHALVQEAAYESMLRSTRRRLHARIAATLERDFSGRVKSSPELLAYHYSAAQLHEQGFRYWFLASQHALRHCAHEEVAAHLYRGLELVTKLPDKPELRAMELEMRALLRDTLQVLAGSGRDHDVPAAFFTLV